MMKKLWKWGSRFLLLVVFLILCTVGVLVFQGWQVYQEAIRETPMSEKVGSVQKQEDYTQIGELPKVYLDAVLAAEDHRFYDHGGIDLFAIARACFHDLITLSLEEGGSTITQQLAKNLYFTQEKSLVRKIAEVFVALDLEREYEKNEILELYLNSIYFGNGCYTVRSASLAYFGKEPGEMTPFESTLLAGIPNAPSVYDLTENPDLAAQRQKQVVSAMVRNKFLSEQEAREIFA